MAPRLDPSPQSPARQYSGVMTPRTRGKDGGLVYNCGRPLAKALPEDTTRCIAEVYEDPQSKWPFFIQCSRRRGKGPEGLFCGTHANCIARANRAGEGRS